MGARDLVTVDPQKFEELLSQNKLNVQQAAEAWGIARASLQKIRAGTAISKALASKIMLKARAKDSILVLQDKNPEEILTLELKPFFSELVDPDTLQDPELPEFKRNQIIDCFPVNALDWLPPNDDRPDKATTIHWIKDQIRLHKCDEISLSRIGKAGRWLAIEPYYNDIAYNIKKIQPVWHSDLGIVISPKALQALKSLREILLDNTPSNKVGASLDDIIASASEQTGLSEILEDLEKEGLSIFGQRITTLKPFQDWSESMQGFACDKVEHGFLVIADSEFDAIEMTYHRWVKANTYKVMMKNDHIRRLNIDKN